MVLPVSTVVVSDLENHFSSSIKGIQEGEECVATYHATSTVKREQRILKIIEMVNSLRNCNINSTLRDRTIAIPLLGLRRDLRLVKRELDKFFGRIPSVHSNSSSQPSLGLGMMTLSSLLGLPTTSPLSLSRNELIQKRNRSNSRKPRMPAKIRMRIQNIFQGLHLSALATGVTSNEMASLRSNL